MAKFLRKKSNPITELKKEIDSIPRNIEHIPIELSSRRDSTPIDNDIEYTQGTPKVVTMLSQPTNAWPSSATNNTSVNYTEASIVDYMKAAGYKDTSLQARKTLGNELGINNVGTASGNLTLLRKLRENNPQSQKQASTQTQVQATTPVIPSTKKQNTTPKNSVPTTPQQTSNGPVSNVPTYNNFSTTNSSHLRQSPVNNPVAERQKLEQSKTNAVSATKALSVPWQAGLVPNAKSYNPNSNVGKNKRLDELRVKMGYNLNEKKFAYIPTTDELEKLSSSELQEYKKLDPQGYAAAFGADLVNKVEDVVGMVAGPVLAGATLAKDAYETQKAYKALKSTSTAMTSKNNIENFARMTTEGLKAARKAPTTIPESKNVIRLTEYPKSTIPNNVASYTHYNKLMNIEKNLNNADIGLGFSAADKKRLANIKRNLTKSEKAVAAENAVKSRLANIKRALTIAEKEY